MTSVKEAEAITDFFVNNFWENPISKPKQRQQLTKEVYNDLTTRYMSTTGKAVRNGLITRHVLSCPFSPHG